MFDWTVSITFVMNGVFMLPGYFRWSLLRSQRAQIRRYRNSVCSVLLGINNDLVWYGGPQAVMDVQVYCNHPNDLDKFDPGAIIVRRIRS